ncbi:Soluble lytic murein transglycosylase or regulatory protein s (may contain LysM/invasin domain) (MltE) (PDB:153L) [Commensalibacter communis]|nr:Soluble lytic murein transglycosylase or regulatory protein s (may contain LysM/invasin domain) (MltE) (PDB:153L) [Commensalibacter communis]
MTLTKQSFSDIPIHNCLIKVRIRMTIHHKIQHHSLLYVLRFSPILALILLTACGGGGNKNKSGVVSSRYSNYMDNHPEWRPPGPPADPWGPYINQSSQRFNVPDQWIRAVIMQESRGYQYYNKRPITSPHGAKGLMQLKTPTYRDMAKRYKLGKDPYNPQDNIMAGTAYIRILYNQFGAPGFVAAYHGGPGTLSNHLKHGSSLPKATKQYLTAVSAKLGNDIPMSGPFAKYASGSSRRSKSKTPLPLEAYYTPKSYAPTTMVAQNTVQPRKRRSLKSGSTYKPMTPIYPTQSQPRPNIVQVAYAPTASASKGNWGVQVGAYPSISLAQQATAKAQSKIADSFSFASPSIESVNKNGTTLYRARLTGISQISAIQACRQLKQKGMNCITVQ